MRAFFLRPVSGFVLAVVATLSPAFSFISAAAPAAGQPPAPPADVAKVLSDIADLDLLKALAPLKLTSEQIGKIKTPLKEIATENAARRKADYEVLRALAADLSRAREEALAGGTVSTETENKVMKTFNAAEDRLIKVREDAVNRVFAAVKESLTADQKDEVERQVGKMLGGKRLIPKEYRNDPRKAPKEAVQALALRMYVERILIADRTLDLLEAMKPNTTGETKAGNEGG
ncbi:MAG: hypothetical protein SFU56_21620 [Capsulimonadales bacterium]|nr:hypothetical protein [Capsulimonadales bacterium]